MPFFSHGDFSFKVEGNIFIIEAVGPWNVDALLNSRPDVSLVHKKLYGKKWGVLAIIHGEPIHTPAAAKMVTEIIVNDKKNGRVASAIILDESKTASLANHP